jgi:hypothetical protein
LKPRKQRSILIKTNPDGTIKERYRVLVEDDFDPRPGYIELTRESDRNLMGRNMNDVMFKAGRVIEKPVVHIVVKKGEILADGKDEAEVHLVGVPDDMEEVDVKIGNTIHKVNPKEPFKINTTHPQQITINVVNKTLKTKPAYVRSVRKIRRVT